MPRRTLATVLTLLTLPTLPTLPTLLMSRADFRRHQEEHRHEVPYDGVGNDGVGNVISLKNLRGSG